MYQSSLVQLFQAFDKADVQAVRKMVNSPYFNHRQDVIQLFEYLSKVTRRPSRSSFDRKRIFEAIFPETPFDLVRLRHLMSQLTLLIKRYLVDRELQLQDRQYQLFLCQALRKKGLQKLYEKELLKIQNQHNQQFIRNANFHYFQYLLHSEQYEAAVAESRIGDMPLQELSDELTIFFLADTLRYGCTILTHSSLQKQTYPQQLLPEVLRHIEQSDYSNIPAVAIYYHAYKALKHIDNIGNFRELCRLIEVCENRFDANEMSGIYLLAINYCIRQLNSGQKTFIREAFELYRKGFAKRLFLDNGYVSGFNFKNALRLGIALKEYEWVQSTLDQHETLLHPEKRENTYQYNLAYFLFQRKEYPKALQLLSTVDFKDALNNLDARRMLLRIYYELGEYDALSSLLDSFSVYIHRQKGIGYHRENYLALIRIVKKMLSRNLSDKEARETLRLQVEATDSIAEKEWLLDQLR